MKKMILSCAMLFALATIAPVVAQDGGCKKSCATEKSCSKPCDKPCDKPCKKAGSEKKECKK